MNQKNLFGLVGKNISYSFSVKYFANKFELEKIKDAQYLNFDIPTIEHWFDKIHSLSNLRGFNVTIPYKQEVIPYLSQLDWVAEQIGAVNVVKVLPNNILKGYNTDCYGFEHSLLPLLKSTHKKALILGTGGASKAVTYVLQQKQIPYKQVSRNPKLHQLSYDDLTKEIMEEFTIIVNCTPLGTFPKVEDFPPIPYRYITSEHLLYDLIYNPSKTMFLLQGEKKGARICNGEQMLILQAEASWKIWNE